MPATRQRQAACYAARSHHISYSNTNTNAWTPLVTLQEEARQVVHVHRQ